MLKDIINAYNDAVLDTDREAAFHVIDEALKAGITPEEIVFQVVIPAIEQMLKSISQDFDANLAQHFMASRIASEVTEAMIARFQTKPVLQGSVVIGTSRGDLHSLGKKIVSGCLKAMMIDVIDIGVNVAPEHFVEHAVQNNAQVIAISAMMIHTAMGENGCLSVRRILKERNLEDRIKIIVGGAPYRFDPQLYQTVKADTWAPDGISAGKEVEKLIRMVKK